jgi:hypothetical protein
MRFFLPVTFGVALALTAQAGTYYMPFDLPDQVLPYDPFPGTPSTVLAPAGVYQGASDDTVTQLLGGDLVLSDPTGGASFEYASVALSAGPPTNDFDGGAVLRATIAGSTLEAIRDYAAPGLAVGLLFVDNDDNSYFFAAVNRTTAGADRFNSPGPGLANNSLLTPGTGYFAVWQLGLTAAPSVIAAAPIPAGTLGNTQLEFSFDSSNVANYAVNGIALHTGHALAETPNRGGILVMQWGTSSGNLAYSNIRFTSMRADGDEVGDGGDPVPLPGAGIAGLIGCVALVTGYGIRRLRLVRSNV